MIPRVRPVVVCSRYRAAKVEPRCPTVRKFRLHGADLGFTAANRLTLPLKPRPELRNRMLMTGEFTLKQLAGLTSEVAQF